MTTHAPASDPLAAACLVQGIELGAVLGRGRFATVFAGRWRERDVAVKVVAGRADGRPPRALDHPAILDVLEVGEALGQRYLVLERFPRTCAASSAGKPLRKDLLRPVLLPLLDGLEHAHARGVAHGDLKPANVLVDPAARPPRVVLADFGGGARRARTTWTCRWRAAARATPRGRPPWPTWRPSGWAPGRVRPRPRPTCGPSA
jgi:serine/threonine protein kinase